MSIITWSLKEGDKVKVYLTLRHPGKIVKIEKGPYNYSSRRYVCIIFEENKMAIFSENRQKWFYV